MDRIAIFALASAMGIAAGAAEIGGMQVTFVQDGEVCGSFVNRSTYYKPWDVDGARRFPESAKNGLLRMDDFQVRGNGILRMPTSGRYRVKIIADDALSVMLGGRVAVSQTAYSSGREFQSDVFDLEGGRGYPISFSFREGTGSELCQIRLLDEDKGEAIWISGTHLEPVPEPWTFFEHGAPSVHGGVEYNPTNKSFSVTGAGRGFMYSGDEIDTLTAPSGDGDFVFMATVSVPAKGAAALVARTDLADASCPGVSVAVRPSGLVFAVREASGGAVRATSFPMTFKAGSYVMLRLVRRGSVISAHYVTTRGTWDECGSFSGSDAWAGDIRVGFGVFSRALGETDVARFSSLSLIPVDVSAHLEAETRADGTIACRVRTDTAAEERIRAAERMGAGSWWWSDSYASPVTYWKVSAVESVPDGVEARTDSANTRWDGSCVLRAWSGDAGAQVTVTAAPAPRIFSSGELALGDMEVSVGSAPLELSGNGLFQAIYQSWQSGPSAATPNATLLGSIPDAWSVSDGAYVADNGFAAGSQNFFSIWEGSLTVPESGYYRFRQEYLNGCAKMSFAGADVFADFDRVTETRVDESGWIRLVAGRAYPISVMWRKANGSGSGSFSFKVQWHDGGGWRAVPKAWLSTSRRADSPVRLDSAGVFGEWRDYDIGSTIAGNSILEGTLSHGGYSPDCFNLVFLASSGEGSFDNGLTSDAVHFLARPIEGDFLVEANVSIPTGYNDGRGVWRRIGLCVREDPTDASSRAITAVRSFADGRLMAQMRATRGAKLTTYKSVNLGTRTARIGLERLEGKLSLYLDGRRIDRRSLSGWPDRLYVGFAGSSWAKEHQAVTFFQNCVVKRQHLRGFFIKIGEPQPDPLDFSMADFSPVYKAQVTKYDDGSVRLRLPSAEWNSGLSYTSEEGVDLSRGRYLALDVENLSATRQMRLTMHVAAGGVVTDSDDHAAAVLAQNRSVNTGIALNPGEKGTMMLLLPHAEIYHYPDGARGVYSIDTHHVTEIAVKIQWPYEQEFNYVADSRLSNLRLVQMPRRERAVDPDKYLPFVDKYGQFVHDTWPEKVTSDDEFAKDLASERAELRQAPDSWDSYGGWKNGPKLAATGHFRTQKVDGKWWLVTPEGHLFFSVGVNVARTMTDATYGPTHRDWYTSDVNRNGSMSYTLWNLQKKFGTSSYESPYYDFLIDRMNSWGLNTIGNWSAGALYSKGRKPYVCTIYSRNSSVPALSNYGWYDCMASNFKSSLAAAVKASAEADSALKKALTDPMCIGFFIDNEPPLSGALSASGANDRDFYRAYFGACRDAVKAIAPDKLYLGCRFVGFRQSSALLAAAGEFCDVVSVNGYCNSLYNVPQGMLSGNGYDKPILHTEFHFGCIDRGMFSAGLCPAGTQAERARLYRRFVEGALMHPNIVGCHWFQYRDQPLQGRGDGEAYQVGFVDVCDRPYRELVRAARKIGETMYEGRKNGVW